MLDAHYLAEILARTEKEKLIEIFSSPELQAHKVCLEYRNDLLSIVHTFKMEYLRGQLANLDQFLYVASLVWSKAAIGFGADGIETLVSMAAQSSHKLIMRKMLPEDSAFVFEKGISSNL